MGGNTQSKKGTIQRPTKRPLPNLAGQFSELQPFLLDDVSHDMTELGSGSYAVVKKITRRGETYAAKQLHASLFQFASPEEKNFLLSQFARECRLLQRAAHPNVVKFVGLHLDQTLPLPYLVMEYMQATLSGHLDKNGSPDSPTALRILSDVALGLQFLHKHIPAIIHRDLSANNVLLSSNLLAKISDLGMAKIIDQGGQKSKMTQTKAPGTPSYMPPEALRDKPHYDTSIDTFSFGVLMVHVLSGQWPLPVHGNKVDPNNPNQLIALTEFQCRMKYIKDAGLDHPLMPLIEDCLHNNPMNRPNAPDIAETVMAVMADEIMPKIYVAIKNYESKTSYELSSQVGERFLVYGDALSGGSLVKVASRSSRQVGYIPKGTIHKLENLYMSTKIYIAQRKEEVSISSKEFMFVLDREGSWLYVEVLSSGKKGLVPNKHIVKFKPMDETE
ncbi:Serine/threonine-protein kinase CTR1 [Geodia barretti]|uniref:mitogen-activated protein kinase kinase kinase n=1 Tax=Geodia barretti TaxID=519541 RepID=A0AA35RCD0_GEOBA|nr:Serine/threonine-protein kinase CTR1 [Geodia barretti]